MIEFIVLGAAGVCEASLVYAVYVDYRVEKAEGKVKTFGEYLGNGLSKFSYPDDFLL